jgi:hypothetical protein
MKKIVAEPYRDIDFTGAKQGAVLAALKVDIEQGKADKLAGRVAPLNIDAIKAEGRKQRSARTDA